MLSPKPLPEDEDFILLDEKENGKPILKPPCSRPYDNYAATNQTKTHQSAHETEIVQKNTKPGSDYRYILKHLKDNPRDDPDNLIAPLEALAANYCRSLTGLELTPSTHAVHDNKGRYVGVTSRKYREFKSNHEDPLREDDLNIDIDTSHVSARKAAICNSIKDLKKHFQNRAKKSSFINFLNPINLLTSEMNADTLISHLEAYEKATYQLSPHTIKALVYALEERKKHIAKLNKLAEYQSELDLIKTILDRAKDLDTHLAIELELAYQAIKKQDLDVDLETLLTLPDEELNKKIFTGHIQYDALQIKTDFKLTGKDLKNSLIQRNLGISLTARFLCRERDLHNRNLSKMGQNIDFDSCKPETFSFKEKTEIEEYYRTPFATTFSLTVEQASHFPDIQPPNLLYWPTNPANMAESVRNILAPLFDLAPNFFTEEDHKLYKRLKDSPIFVFHYLKTVLIALLSTKDMDQALTHLQLPHDALYHLPIAAPAHPLISVPKLIARGTLPEKPKFELPLGAKCKEGSMLSDVCIENDMLYLEEIRKTYIEVPIFQDLLEQYGDFVFHELVHTHYHDYREHYAKKLDRKPHFKPLVDAINLKEMEKSYYALKEAALADKKRKADELNHFEHIPQDSTSASMLKVKC